MTRYVFTPEVLDSLGNTGSSQQEVVIDYGSPPDTYANLTFWMSAIGSVRTEATYDSILYTEEIESMAGINRKMVCFGVTHDASTLWTHFRVTYSFTYPSVQITCQVKTTSAIVNLFTLIGTSAKTIIIGMQIDDAPTLAESGGLYCNQGKFLLSDYGNFYIKLEREGSIVHIVISSISTAFIFNSVIIPVELGERFVLSIKHASNVLMARKNAGAWYTVPCPTSNNTSSQAYFVVEDPGAPTDFDVRIGEYITYNVARTDAEIAAVEKFVASQLQMAL